jgi:hypothetical protein
LPADLEELNEIVDLTMNVPADSHRASHRLHVALFYQYLTGFFAQQFHLRFTERLALV